MAEDPSLLLLLEYLRHIFIEDLRSFHSSEIPRVIQIDPPKMSFNRWLVDRHVLLDLVDDEGRDSLIPGKVEPQVSVSLAREIIEDLPVKVPMFPRDVADARRSLQKYLNAGFEVLHHPPAGGKILEEEQVATLKNHLQSANARLERPDTTDAIMDHLRRLKMQCGPLFEEIFRPLVDQVCRDLSIMADEQVKTLSSIRTSFQNSKRPIEIKGSSLLRFDSF